MNTLQRLGYHRAMMLKAADPEYKLFHQDRCHELLDELLESCPEIADEVKSQFLDVDQPRLRRVGVPQVRDAVRALTKIINNEIDQALERLGEAVESVEPIANLVDTQESIYWMEEEIERRTS